MPISSGLTWGSNLPPWASADHAVAPHAKAPPTAMAVRSKPRRVISSGWLMSSLPLDAVEILIGSQEDLAIRDGRRCIDRFVDLVRGEQFELAPRFENEGCSFQV